MTYSKKAKRLQGRDRQRTEDGRRRLSPRKACLVLCLTAALRVWPAQAEKVWVVSHETLYDFDVDTGVSQAIGPTGADGVEIYDMALGPDGLLYAIGNSVFDFDLYAIDARTGSATAIGPLPALDILEDRNALAFDASGELWLAAGTSLYRVETATGMVTKMADLEREVLAMAALGDELFALTIDPPDSVRLELIEPDTLELRLRFHLPDTQEFIWDATFDSQGHLRILTQGGSLLQNVALLFYAADVSTGAVERTHVAVIHFTQRLAGIRSLAGPQGSALAAAIPALDGKALALFAALLLAAALARFRRSGASMDTTG